MLTVSCPILSQSTPIREAVERMVAVGKMSADEVDVLSAHELPLASSGRHGVNQNKGEIRMTGKGVRR
jgi:hypothetical protein